MSAGQFKTWISQTAGSMTLAIAGQSGAGKSALLKNLFGLEDHSPSSDTKCVQVYNCNFENTQLTIVDIPGLDSSAQQPEIISQLQHKTNGEADLLLYCVSIAPSSRLGDLDSKIVNLLTTVFKTQIWERAVLILTFADYVNERHAKNPAENPTIEHVMKDYVQAFEKILKAVHIDSFTVLSLHDQGLSKGERLRPLHQIPALPVGETPGEKLLPNTKWDEHLYLEMLTKCTLDAVPLLLNAAKDQILKGNTTKQVAIGAFLGLNFGTGAVYLITRGIGMTSVTGIILGVLIGGIVGVIAAVLVGSASKSLAYSVAKTRFQTEKKQH